MGIGTNQYIQTPQFVMPEQYVQPMAPSYQQFNVPFLYKKDKKGNNTTTPLPVDQQGSMADQMIARAQYAYEHMMPPATLAQLFPTLAPAMQQSLNQVSSSSGAGRFLGGNIPSGLLNFNAPTTKA